MFSLCVDDFGVKYKKKEDLLDLQNLIETKYTCKIDWSGRTYLGFNFDWNFDKGYVDVSMPKYIPNALKKFRYEVHKHPQYSPYSHLNTKWTKKGEQQFLTPSDTSELLSVKEI